MNTISNDVRIKLLCELAHNRVEQADTSYIIEDSFGTKYTEEGQGLFNEYYDEYEGIILDNLELVEDHNYKQREDE